MTQYYEVIDASKEAPVREDEEYPGIFGVLLENGDIPTRRVFRADNMWDNSSGEVTHWLRPLPEGSVVVDAETWNNMQNCVEALKELHRCGFDIYGRSNVSLNEHSFAMSKAKQALSQLNK